ncbi:MAG: class I SAM-dependent methyltransferase [Myxococcota bacterium]
MSGPASAAPSDEPAVGASTTDYEQLLDDARRLAPAERDARFRHLERQWQEEVGRHLLDVPHGAAGSRAVFAHQFGYVIDEIDFERGGFLVEVGCGKGHFLAEVGARCGSSGPTPVGIDLSRAVQDLPAKGLAGLRADGEALPFRDGSVSSVIYDGALHHLIDFRAALRTAHRILEPGGRILIFEPVSSPFTRLVHRVLDPIVFRKVMYESPIDQEYKDYFHEQVILDALRELGMEPSARRSDFLAYPLTGCYAGSAFGRSERLMKALLAVESWMMRVPVLRSLAAALCWRVLIVARKADTDAGTAP